MVVAPLSSGMYPAAPGTVANPTTEGQVIDNAVAAGKQVLDTALPAAASEEAGVLNQSVSLVQQAATNAVDGTMATGLHLGDRFVQGLDAGAQQFASGTVNVLTTRADKSIDQYIDGKAKSIERALPDFLRPVVEFVAHEFESLLHSAVGRAGAYGLKELDSVVESALKRVDPILASLAQKVTTPADEAIASVGPTVEQPVDTTLQDGGQQAAHLADQGLSYAGASAKNLLGNLAD